MRERERQRQRQIQRQRQTDTQTDEDKVNLNKHIAENVCLKYEPGDQKYPYMIYNTDRLNLNDLM